MRRPRSSVAASFSLAFAMTAVVGGAVVCSGSRALADPPSADGQDQSAKTGAEGSAKLEMKKMQQQEFLKKHSDASGKPRPDLWRKGIEDQKKMQVAPYVGWHASDATSKSSPTADK